MSAENYRSTTKSHDPGWNDPPKLSYSPGVAATGQTPKLNLNKRVAFPVAGTTAANQAPPPVPVAAGGSSLPQFIPVASIGSPRAGPPPSVNPSVLPPPMGTVGTPPRVGQIDRPCSNPVEDLLVYPKNEEMRDFVKRILEDFLLKTDNSRQAEIRKRLDLMQQSWNDGILSDGLTRKLYRLAYALNEGKVTEANENHRSIIVEHGKECVQWAPALRQLIQAVPKQEETTTETSRDEKEAIAKPL